MAKMTTAAIEDYLKAIYQIADSGTSVSTSRLAEALRLSPSSVTGMLRKLSDLGLVVYERYRGVELTESGKQAALRTLRYHRLAELYLSEVLGLPWDEVHEEADRWEHVLSPRVAERMAAALGDPTSDPHGEPIPATDGTVAARSVAPLSSLGAGTSASVAQVNSRDPQLLRYLAQMGFFPGARVRVEEVGAFEGLLTVRLGDAHHVLGRAVADHVFVDDVGDDERSRRAHGGNDD
jgi:DtxR family transcriptional regulator, Mn-dependent transcriptional regulator